MMDRCDVLIVGGGPSGSACAWKLRRAGLDVVIMDRSRFPRDKACAGWITPPVLDDLQLDVDEYRRGRTFQMRRKAAPATMPTSITSPHMTTSSSGNMVCMYSMKAPPRCEGFWCYGRRIVAASMRQSSVTASRPFRLAAAARTPIAIDFAKNRTEASAIEAFAPPG